MNDTVFLLLLFGAVIGSLVYQFFFNKRAVFKRKLAQTPLRKISELENGQLFKFRGTVEYLDTPIISPLTKRGCAYFFARVTERKSGNNSSSFRTIIKESSGRRFLVKDEESIVLIDGSIVKSLIDFDRNFESGTLNNATPELERFLNDRGHSSENFLGFNRTLRYNEGILEKGEKVIITGMGEWKDATEYDIPGQYDKVFVMKPTYDHPIHISDDWELVNEK